MPAARPKTLTVKAFEEMKADKGRTDSKRSLFQKCFLLLPKDKRGKEYPIHCRKKGRICQPKKVYYWIVTQWPKGKTYMNSQCLAQSLRTRLLLALYASRLLLGREDHTIYWLKT